MKWILLIIFGMAVIGMVNAQVSINNKYTSTAKLDLKDIQIDKGNYIFQTQNSKLNITIKPLGFDKAITPEIIIRNDRIYSRQSYQVSGAEALLLSKNILIVNFSINFYENMTRYNYSAINPQNNKTKEIVICPYCINPIPFGDRILAFMKDFSLNIQHMNGKNDTIQGLILNETGIGTTYTAVVQFTIPDLIVFDIISIEDSIVEFDSTPFYDARWTKTQTHINWTHTISGTNRLLVVGAVSGTSGILNATYNNVAMSTIAYHGNTCSADSKYDLFYLVNPPLGDGTVNVTTTLANYLVAGSTSFSGVDQNNPFGNTNMSYLNSGTTISARIPSTVGNMVVYVGGTGSSVSSSGNTIKWVHNIDTLGCQGNGLGAIEAGAAMVNLNFTAGDTDNLAINAIEIMASVPMELNGTLNLSNIYKNDIVNMTLSISDDYNLTNATIYLNDTGVRRDFNFTFRGINSTVISQNFTISCGGDCVVEMVGIFYDNNSNNKNYTNITRIQYRQFIDDNRSDFIQGNFTNTNASNQSTVILDYSIMRAPRLDAGNLNYTRYGTFESRIFDTLYLDSRIASIVPTSVLPNVSTVVGIANDDASNLAAMFYRNGSYSNTSASTALNANKAFTFAMMTYSNTDLDYDDIIGIGMDDSANDVVVLLLRNGSTMSTADLGNTALSRDITFNNMSTWTLPTNINVSQVTGFDIDMSAGSANGNAFVTLNNKTVITFDKGGRPPYTWSNYSSYSIPAILSPNNTIESTIDNSGNDYAMFFINGTHTTDATQSNTYTAIAYVTHYVWTIYPGMNYSNMANITLEARVSNNSVSWTNYEYYNNMTNYIGRYVQYRLTLNSPSKWDTPSVDSVVISYERGIISGGVDTPPTASISINNTAIDMWHTINISGNSTDDIGLDDCWLYENVTNTNFSTKPLSGTMSNCSFAYYVDNCGFFNFTIYVNDTAGNIGQNSTLLNLSTCQIQSMSNITVVSSGVGSAWVNPTNVNLTDDIYATNTIGSGTPTKYLNTTNLSFTLPTSSISGIKLKIETKEDLIATSVYDTTISLSKAYASIGDNKATNTWSTTEINYTYGGYYDLWGTIWTASDINNPGFGVLPRWSVALAGLASVDSIQVVVFYNVTATASTTCTCPHTAIACSDNCVLTDCDEQAGNPYIYGTTGSTEITGTLRNYLTFANFGCTLVCKNQNGCFG